MYEPMNKLRKTIINSMLSPDIRNPVSVTMMMSITIHTCTCICMYNVGIACVQQVEANSHSMKRYM